MNAERPLSSQDADDDTPAASGRVQPLLQRALDVAYAAGAGVLGGTAAWSVTDGAHVALGAVSDPRKLDALVGSMNRALVIGIVLVPVALVLIERLSAGSWRTPRPRSAGFVAVVSMVALAARVWINISPLSSWVVLSAGVAIGLGVGLSSLWERVVGERRMPLTWVAALLPAVVAFVVYTIWSVTRHTHYGTGSWDYGYYNNVTWLIAHNGSYVSSVLGDVYFLGDHFIPIMFLFAPLAYFGSTSALLVAQAFLLSLGVVPLTLLARRADLGPLSVLGLCTCYLFAVGTQSQQVFDFHEIAAVPAALLFAFWGFLSNRRWVFYSSLLIVFLSKESAILYVGAVGAWVVVFGQGRRKLEGLAIGAFCLVAFFLVVGWLQPKLLEGGPQGMIHLARFKAFGDSASSAAINMLLHPAKTLIVLVSPERKLETLNNTYGTFGYLSLLSPEAYLLSAPNLMERFLSDKREMWTLHFHYSVVLITISAFGTLRVAGKALVRFASARNASAASHRRRWAGFDVALGVLLLSSVVGANELAPKDPDLKKLKQPYYATPEQAERYARALAVIPDDAKVVAQNYFLAHLSFRQYVWQPQDRFFERADYAILDPASSAWPHNKPHVKRWVGRLLDDDGWQLVFSDKTTAVFARGGAAVTPSPELLRSIGR